MNIGLFETVVICWWLALGAVGHACWWAAFFRSRIYRRRINWLDRLDVAVGLPFSMAGGLFTLGAAVCFEPGKDLR